MGVKAHAAVTPRRWRLTFDTNDMPIRTVAVASGDTRSVDDAVRLFKNYVHEAMSQGGCRSVVIGVHVEGEACDHEV